MSPFRLSGVKYSYRYCVMNRPRRSPKSSSRNSAHRSMRPLELGVPVSPMTRLTVGRTRIRTLNRLDWWLLKEDSSSITTVSKSKGKPLSSISQARFSRLMIVMSALFIRATRRSLALPIATV